ncbi:unnamed protein product [Menidia menidia]|uniref:(Atlantic silverside) hypothetical protein n=1 Tax=Menidia menidia TaxID=238744 RepID=A0A8S4AZ95_9TELE|nr:unnamed protein product [Menidia menidia]
MNNSDDEMEEDDTEWSKSFVDSEAFAPSAPLSGSSMNMTPRPTRKVILHFDLDCFYAQVEMIRNPALRLVPLGIQQKYIVVTCNYVARERGVNKLMSITDAKEKCPDLVLVKGEDLTHYREMSYKVTGLLMSYCPLVERLGFDENFLDVTEMVERRLDQTVDPDSFSFKGHVYNHFGADVRACDHPRLALASHIAAELREAIHSELGLTGCAGVATNKLLAKLVSGTFKPNQQTVLLPENVNDIMGSLSGLRKVPGVGHQTAKKLQALGLVSVKDLQLCPLNDLVREFGGPTSQRLKNLALGIDDSPVTPTGAPQSLSDEDSFKKMSSTTEVLEKIRELLTSLGERMHKDGRLPQTFRLTIRRYSATNKWFSRESRQLPIPIHIAQKMTSGSTEDAVVQLVPLAMKLFHKMVDSNAAFHLTLINVCFSNLQTRAAAVSGKGAITSFFSQSSPPKKKQLEDSSQDARRRCLDEGEVGVHNTNRGKVTTQSSFSSAAASQGVEQKQSSLHAAEEEQRESGCFLKETNNLASVRLPPNVDPEVFELLPEEIQQELLATAHLHTKSSVLSSPSFADDPFTPNINPPRPSTNSPPTEKTKNAAKTLDISHRATSPSPQWPAGISGVQRDSTTEQGKPSSPQSSGCDFPGNVDPAVFSELPYDVQRELMSEWKRERPVQKTPSSRKPGRNVMAKERDRRAAGRSSQANNLLNYFKPS